MAKPVNVLGTASTIAIDTAANIANCTAVDMSRVDSLALEVATGTSLGTITVYASLTESGTYRILRDSYTAQDVTFTATAARAYLLPPPAQGWPRWIKLVCSGTATTVAAEGKRVSRF